MKNPPFWKRIFNPNVAKKEGYPVITHRRVHRLPTKLISQNALKVLHRLDKAGYAAYLVGGGVRDLLLKGQPKDFDVVTNALPEEIRKVFRNSRLIGRRFRIVHVFYPGEIIEVSTFRAGVQPEAESLPQMVQSDNSYGTIEEDAWRRDFTVNALFYNIKDSSIEDYTCGMKDLQNKQLRMIGDPVQRYHEDPVRLLRAIRLSAKLAFVIEPQTKAPILELASLLEHVPKSRLFEEVLKFFYGGYAFAAYQSLTELQYFEKLFPQTVEALATGKFEHKIFIDLALQATDTRFNEGLSLNPGFLLAVFLWPAVEKEIEIQKTQHDHLFQVLHAAIENVLNRQMQTLTIPKRFTAMMQSIWLLQYHLERRRGKRAIRALTHRYFRAAFDFLELRAKSGEPYQEVCQWWYQFQTARPKLRDDMLAKLR